MTASVALPFAASAGDRIAFVTTPEQALTTRLALIAGEQQEVMVDLNIVESQGRAGEVLEALCKAAEGGVRVRIVTDFLAAHFWNAGGLTTESAAALNAKCGPKFEIRFWNLVEMNSPIDYLRSRKLRRDHDKVMVFRSQNIVYAGDRNSQAVNYRDAEGRSYISIDAVAEGRASAKAATYFEAVWKETESLSGAPIEKAPEAKQIREPVTKSDSKSPLAHLSWIETPAEFLNYNPNNRLTSSARFEDTEGFNGRLVSLVSSAKRELVISTPFLRLPPELFRAIEARKRAGVSVTLVTSRADSKIIPKVLTQNRDIKRLMKLGVVIDQKNSSDELHAKLIVVDGERAFIGSHNFNMRGSFMDLEAGLLIDNRDAAQIVRAFALDGLSPYVMRSSDFKTVLLEGVLGICSYCNEQF